MAETPVLRFPISGQEDGSFLLEVSSSGSRPLDLKLVGSESTAVFLVKLRQKKINEYKASSSHCTDEEWQQILTSIFVDLKPIPDIEVRADLQSDGSSITLSFRKNIQGITQRLGSIKLDENDNSEISPFDWCVSAIASRTKVTEELAAATAKIEALENSVNELKAQLDDFIKTKEEDEAQLLEKFRDLLNSKKVKIRQQQRLLAAAKVDPEKLANIGVSSQSAHRDAGPSRSAKRKAAVKIKEEEDSDDGFENMDIDEPDAGSDAGSHGQPESDPDVDQDQQVSTENDQTASDPDSDHEPQLVAAVQKKKAISPPRHSTRSAASGSKQKALPSRNAKGPKQKEPTAAATDSQDEDSAPPPPRNLPFMKNKKAPPPPPQPADDDETPSDDGSEL
ncbi:hypothetical protein F5Y19DRAFT_370941 [Xylariaceae sp. FL1651]|nr:hypothetical protein F5Y19DRAFT_370941 [Xylariaceae sp. FL1651]